LRYDTHCTRVAVFPEANLIFATFNLSTISFTIHGKEYEKRDNSSSVGWIESGHVACRDILAQLVAYTISSFQIYFLSYDRGSSNPFYMGQLNLSSSPFGIVFGRDAQEAYILQSFDDSGNGKKKIQIYDVPQERHQEPSSTKMKMRLPPISSSSIVSIEVDHMEGYNRVWILTCNGSIWRQDQVDGSIWRKEQKEEKAKRKTKNQRRKTPPWKLITKLNSWKDQGKIMSFQFMKFDSFLSCSVSSFATEAATSFSFSHRLRILGLWNDCVTIFNFDIVHNALIDWWDIPLSIPRSRPVTFCDRFMVTREDGGAEVDHLYLATIQGLMIFKCTQ